MMLLQVRRRWRRGRVERRRTPRRSRQRQTCWRRSRLRRRLRSREKNLGSSEKTSGKNARLVPSSKKQLQHTGGEEPRRKQEAVDNTNADVQVHYLIITACYQQCRLCETFL